MGSGLALAVVGGVEWQGRVLRLVPQNMKLPNFSLQLLALGFSITLAYSAEEVRPFSKDGKPEGWLVRSWSNVGELPEKPSEWLVKDGVLHGSNPRGTWLVSEKEYADFVLEFEWKLGPQGNGGVGLRFPLWGDPAFDGLEVQMVDPRYYGNYKAKPEELTGAIYPVLAPKAQVYRPEDWNSYQITCQGTRVKVVLNGEVLHDVDLAMHSQKLERGVPLAERPRRGRIGFQELSRGGGQVLIRNLRLRESDAK